MWSAAAIGVVLVHVAYSSTRRSGGVLAMRDHRWLVPHLAGVTWGVLIVAMQWKCPLTNLERFFWSSAGETGYPGSFLDHYVFGRLLPNGSQPWVYGLHLVVILLVYTLLARSWAQARRPELA